MKTMVVFMMIFQALQLFFPAASSQTFIGVNYGDVADNLPPPATTARLLRSTMISKLRLYDTNPAMISAVSDTGVTLLLGAANGDIPTLAASPSAAAAWAAAHLPSPAAISSISVGNEVLTLGDPALRPLLVPAMQNLAGAVAVTGVSVSTVHSMAVLSQSDPPSSGAFDPSLDGALDPLLAFLNRTSSPFMVNPYPYFAYLSDPRNETLAFCLFQPNAGRPDAGAGITYSNMFDAQVDAVRSALDRKGYPGVPIVVAETGWPHHGDPDEAGATVENARAFVSGLVAHLRSNAGTPRMPGHTVETYIFALYDEDLKPGKASERAFGLFAADMTPNYDAGLMRQISAAAPSPTPAPSPSVAIPSVGTAPASAAASRSPAGECVAARGRGAGGGAASGCVLPSAAGERSRVEASSVAFAAAAAVVAFGSGRRR